MRPGKTAFLALVLLAPIPSLTTAQEPPRCAASGWDTLRTAAQVIADVEAAKCAAGSRLDVAMTIAGQAVELQLHPAASWWTPLPAACCLPLLLQHQPHPLHQQLPRLLLPLVGLHCGTIAA